MFRKLSLMCAARLLAIVLLILIENVSHIGGNSASPFASPSAGSALSDTHRLAKRMDLESCLGQFDVHKNTIIRTGESQAIGGKYLQGFQLDTVDECQRLCCETESCDVYIFEDKNDGYCYLFECGPPENFHCKFTRHANYTSAVLTTVRHVTEVTTPRPSLPQIGSANISQQEWELTSLKLKPEARDKTGEGGNLAGGVSVATVGGNLQLTEVGFPQKAANTTAHCGRFQFTCHSGECIAVYNACDGIPQCEDGSDEGPECSGAATSSISVLSPKPNAEPAAVNILEPTVQQAAIIPQYQSPLQQQLQSVQQQSSLINNREDAAAWANRKVVADTQQTDLGNPVDLNSRNIFNHKGGLQLPTNGGGVGGGHPNAATPNLGMYVATANLQRNGIYLPPQQQVPEMMPPSGVYAPTQQQQQQQYMSPQGHMLVPNINWQLQQQPTQQQQLQQQSVATPISPVVGVQLEQQGPAAYIMNAAPPQQPPFLQAPQIKTLSADTNEVAAVAPQAAATPPQTPAIKAAVKSKSEADADEYEDYEEKSTEAPKKKQRKHKKVKSKSSDEPPQTLPADAAAASANKDPIELALEEQKQKSSAPHDEYKTLHEQLALEFRDHDGKSERPGGAVLSLTLGLIVTAALAILIGCRMRTVGRRARRLGGNKTPYSHEADFLVNGMYL